MVNINDSSLGAVPRAQQCLPLHSPQTRVDVGSVYVPSPLPSGSFSCHPPACLLLHVLPPCVVESPAPSCLVVGEIEAACSSEERAIPLCPSRESDSFERDAQLPPLLCSVQPSSPRQHLTPSLPAQRSDRATLLSPTAAAPPTATASSIRKTVRPPSTSSPCPSRVPRSRAAQKSSDSYPSCGPSARTGNTPCCSYRGRR